MAKIIVTSRFIRNSPKQNAGNLVKYMGTREGCLLYTSDAADE